MHYKLASIVSKAILNVEELLDSLDQLIQKVSR